MRMLMKYRVLFLVLLLLAVVGCKQQRIKNDTDVLFIKANELYNSKQYESAYIIFKDLADGGHADSMNQIGVMYDKGFFLDKSQEQAFYWYKKSADSGSHYGLSNCAEYYLLGHYVDKDCDKAMVLYESALDLGSEDAKYDLGFAYYLGTCGEVDYGKACSYFGSINEDSFYYEMAQAVISYAGMCGNANYELAFKLFMNHKDDPKAQFYIGRIYHKGLVGSVDYRKSYEWTKKAAENGDLGAMYSFSVMHIKGQGTNVDYDNALFWAKSGVKAGHPSCLYLIGYCYENGFGVENDISKAIEYYKKASSQGVKLASDALIRLNVR